MALAGLALTFVLAGCGSNNDGTYYIEDVNGTTDLGQLVIDGDSVTHHEYNCEGIDEEPDVTSTGEFNDDQSQITWTVAGDDMRNDRTGTESVTFSDSSITVGEDIYLAEDSDAGKALMQAFEADCND